MLNTEVCPMEGLPGVLSDESVHGLVNDIWSVQVAVPGLNTM